MNDTKESITIFLECDKTKVLGVFGENIHLLTYGYKDLEGNETLDIEDCILVIPIETYLQEWKKWNGSHVLHNHWWRSFNAKRRPQSSTTYRIVVRETESRY